MSKEKLKESVEKMMAKERSRTSPQVRTIYAGEKILKSFHSALGDDGFMSMVKHNEIFTNSQGAAYVEQFVKEQKEKK